MPIEWENYLVSSIRLVLPHKCTICIDPVYEGNEEDTSITVLCWRWYLYPIGDSVGSYVLKGVETTLNGAKAMALWQANQWFLETAHTLFDCYQQVK